VVLCACAVTDVMPSAYRVATEWYRCVASVRPHGQCVGRSTDASTAYLLPNRHGTCSGLSSKDFFEQARTVGAWT
jgi:ribonuclease I